MRITRSAPQVASLRPSIDQPRPRTEERWPERRSFVLSVEEVGEGRWERSRKEVARVGGRPLDLDEEAPVWDRATATWWWPYGASRGVSFDNVLSQVRRLRYDGAFKGPRNLHALPRHRASSRTSRAWQKGCSRRNVKDALINKTFFFFFFRGACVSSVPLLRFVQAMRRLRSTELALALLLAVSCLFHLYTSFHSPPPPTTFSRPIQTESFTMATEQSKHPLPLPFTLPS